MGRWQVLTEVRRGNGQTAVLERTHRKLRGNLPTESQVAQLSEQSLGEAFEHSLWPGMCWNSSSASFPGCISNPRVPGSV